MSNATRNWPICLAVVLTASSGMAEPPSAEVPPKAFAEAVCPVTGKPAQSDQFARFRGRRVYCADQDAVARFTKSPYDYQVGLEAQWKLLKPLRVQLFCPQSGKAVRRDVFIARTWDDIYFAGNAERQLWKRGNDPQVPEQAYSFQTTCATCDNVPRGDVSERLPTRTVFFCCPGCRAGFERERVMFLSEVEAEIKANMAAWLAERRIRPPTSNPAP